LDLPEAAKYLLLNQQVVRATAMSAWSAYVSNDGTCGTQNPVGSWMFGNVDQPATARPTRATTAGEVRVPTRGMDTHVTHGLKTWNVCAELRNARSKAEANRASAQLARNSRCETVRFWPSRALYKPGKTFWQVFGSQQCIAQTALTPGGAKTRRVHRIGRPLQVERSSRPSRTIRCEPCWTGA
jgi:hypothetical protein